MPDFSPIGIGLGIAGTIGKFFSRKKANRELQALEKEDPIYQKNPLVNQRLGYANTLLNARSPGAAMAERNIYSNSANAISNAERGATDASQLLSVVGGVQGQTNDAFNQLGQNETADFQRRYGNYSGALDAEVNEDDKVFSDQTRRFNDKVQLRGAQSENNSNNWRDVSNFGFALGDYGLNGGYSKMARRRIQPQSRGNFIDDNTWG